MTETVGIDAKPVSRTRSAKPTTVSASALARHLDYSRTYIDNLEAEGVNQRQGGRLPLGQTRVASAILASQAAATPRTLAVPLSLGTGLNDYFFVVCPQDELAAKVIRQRVRNIACRHDTTTARASRSIRRNSMSVRCFSAHHRRERAVGHGLAAAAFLKPSKLRGHCPARSAGASSCMSMQTSLEEGIKRHRLAGIFPEQFFTEAGRHGEAVVTADQGMVIRSYRDDLAGFVYDVSHAHYFWRQSSGSVEMDRAALGRWSIHSAPFCSTLCCAPRSKPMPTRHGGEGILSRETFSNQFCCL